jgi:hypothetical protein
VVISLLLFLLGIDNRVNVLNHGMGGWHVTKRVLIYMESGKGKRTLECIALCSSYLGDGM